MILNWNHHRETTPLAFQLLEQITGFKYDVAYGVLMKDGKVITYTDIESFFDRQGWLLTAYPTDFPNWNGIITDTQGKQVFNDPATFTGATTRAHAKSLLAGIALTYFNEVLSEMLNPRKGEKLWLTYKDLNSEGKDKTTAEVDLSSLTLDARGLGEYVEHIVVELADQECKFLKTTAENFPFPGLIFTKQKAHESWTKS